MDRRRRRRTVPRLPTAIRSAGRRPTGAAPVLFVAPLMLFAVACSGDSGASHGAVHVAVPPTPPARAQAACRALAGVLPQQVLNQPRRPTEPRSDATAAWGPKPITLRCGVSTPRSLRPQDPTYDPRQNAVGVNGVSWTFQVSSDGVRFTTLYRDANVEVLVPKGVSTAQPTAPLVDLADAVSRAVPSQMGDDDAP